MRAIVEFQNYINNQFSVTMNCYCWASKKNSKIAIEADRSRKQKYEIIRLSFDKTIFMRMKCIGYIESEKAFEWIPWTAKVQTAQCRTRWKTKIHLWHCFQTICFYTSVSRSYTTLMNSGRNEMIKTGKCFYLEFFHLKLFSWNVFM